MPPAKSQLKIKKLPYTFKNSALLQAALTHRSVNNTSRLLEGEEQDNQRLEFLGDTVLDLVISEFLFQHERHLKEGHMTHIRAGLVCEPRLVEVAGYLELAPRLIMDAGEEQGGGRQKNSILADAMEALLGAIFLDGGYNSVRKVILLLWKNYLNDPAKWDDMLADHKSRLQELAQGLGFGTPSYRQVEASGPAHARLFTMSVILDANNQAQASAYSKKEAEQKAAKTLLDKGLVNA